jgi:hypothetical protein
MRTPDALLLGGLLGLGALVKVSVLGLFPLVGIFVFLFSPGQNRRSVVSRLMVMSVVAAAVAGWWYARNLTLCGDPLNLRVHLESPWAWDRPRALRAALAQMIGVERSFWAMFGSGSVGLPDALYTVLRVGWILALSGWCWTFGRHLLPSTDVGLWGLLAAWVLAIVALQVRWMQLVLAPWGRLLFPALAPIACILTEGGAAWSSLASSRRTWFAAPVMGLLCLSSMAPALVIRPAYALPRQLSAAQVSAQTSPADIQFDDLARLIGYGIDRTSFSPGDWLNARLCWEVTGSTSVDHTLFVQLIGMDGGLVASRHTYPDQGRFQTSQWRPGDRFCEQVRVRVDEHAPAPAVYQVEVGLLQAGGPRRLPVSTRDGPFDGPMFLTRVRVAEESVPLVPVPILLDYRLGEALVLKGREPLETPVLAGHPLSLTLYWAAVSSPAQDYTVFVHIVDRTGRLVAQVDRQPLDGRYPTSSWMAGEIISDTYSLDIPSSALPGRYRLVAGMYAWPDLVRLTVVGPDGQAMPENLVELGDIAVR